MRPPIAAVVLPHGFCLPGRPYCPVAEPRPWLSWSGRSISVAR